MCVCSVQLQTVRIMKMDIFGSLDQIVMVVTANYIEEGESKNIKGSFSSTGCQDLFTGQRWVRQGSCQINPPGMSLFPSHYGRVHMMAAAKEWWEP